LKTKYTVEFVLDKDQLENGGVDIVEPSMDRGLIKADEEGVASWWYQSPSYAIEWKIIKKEEI
jgi:hypothetical protein